ncbi:MAG: hypothetical protein ABSB74_14520 [Tepidisphaeraceae bacterium]
MFSNTWDEIETAPPLICATSRRLDVAEFIEFCIGCRMAPSAALVELMKLRR